jgi:murein DD-endopeptidase MepM/ murein hydrolase activator NlpD
MRYRVQSESFPDTIEGVVTQRRAFTAYDRGEHLPMGPGHRDYAVAEAIARSVLEGTYDPIAVGRDNEAIMFYANVDYVTRDPRGIRDASAATRQAVLDMQAEADAGNGLTLYSDHARSVQHTFANRNGDFDIPNVDSTIPGLLDAIQSGFGEVYNNVAETYGLDQFAFDIPADTSSFPPEFVGPDFSFTEAAVASGLYNDAVVGDTITDSDVARFNNAQRDSRLPTELRGVGDVTVDDTGVPVAEFTYAIGNDLTLPGGPEIITERRRNGETITIGGVEYEVSVAVDENLDGTVTFDRQSPEIFGIGLNFFGGNPDTVTVPEWTRGEVDPDTGEVIVDVASRAFAERSDVLVNLAATGVIDPQEIIGGGCTADSGTCADAYILERAFREQTVGEPVITSDMTETEQLAARLAAQRAVDTISFADLQNQTQESLGITPVNREELSDEQNALLDEFVDALQTELAAIDAQRSALYGTSENPSDATGAEIRAGLEEVSDRYAEVAAAAEIVGEVADGAVAFGTFEEWVNPVQGGRLFGASNGYGDTRYYRNAAGQLMRRSHFGLDLYPEDPTNIEHYQVAAVQDGVVVAVFEGRIDPESGLIETGNYGNQIIIQHTNPDGTVTYSRYNHVALNEGLQVGDTVEQGQNIALIDGSGTFFGRRVDELELTGLSTEAAILAAVDELCNDPCDSWNEWEEGNRRSITPPHLDFEQVLRPTREGGRDGNPIDPTDNLPLADRQLADRGVPPGVDVVPSLARNADGTLDIAAIGRERLSDVAALTTRGGSEPVTAAPPISITPITRTAPEGVGVEGDEVVSADAITGNRSVGTYTDSEGGLTAAGLTVLNQGGFDTRGVGEGTPPTASELEHLIERHTEETPAADTEPEPEMEADESLAPPASEQGIVGQIAENVVDTVVDAAGTVWDTVRDGFSGFFDGDTRTDEEVFQDFFDSTAGDGDENASSTEQDKPTDDRNDSNNNLPDSDRTDSNQNSGIPDERIVSTGTSSELTVNGYVIEWTRGSVGAPGFDAIQVDQFGRELEWTRFKLDDNDPVFAGRKIIDTDIISGQVKLDDGTVMLVSNLQPN